MFSLHPLARNILAARPETPQKASVLRLALVAFVLCGLALPAQAQDAPVPPRFATMQENTDFPGGDLTPVFNTTLEQCHAT